MCKRKFVVINKLGLGSREVGVETWSLPKGELMEFTSKQLKDIIRAGKDEVYGLTISDDEDTLVFDKEFFTTNMMNKTHINNYTPITECDLMVNLFYIVIGSYKEKDGMVYDLISSKYERTQVSEEKLKMMFTMGLISGGAKVEDGKVVVASMTKSKEIQPCAEKNGTVEQKKQHIENNGNKEVKKQA